MSHIAIFGWLIQEYYQHQAKAIESNRFPFMRVYLFKQKLNALFFGEK